jgi:hypothetical protein
MANPLTGSDRHDLPPVEWHIIPIEDVDAVTVGADPARPHRFRVGAKPARPHLFRVALLDDDPELDQAIRQQESATQRQQLRGANPRIQSSPVLVPGLRTAALRAARTLP